MKPCTSESTEDTGAHSRRNHSLSSSHLLLQEREAHHKERSVYSPANHDGNLINKNKSTDLASPGVTSDKTKNSTNAQTRRNSILKGNTAGASLGHGFERLHGTPVQSFPKLSGTAGSWSS